MTHLKIYISENGLTQESFAKVAGLSRSYIAELASGSRRPGRSAIEKIADATNGVVPASSWFENQTSADKAST